MAIIILKLSRALPKPPSQPSNNNAYICRLLINKSTHSSDQLFMVLLKCIKHSYVNAFDAILDSISKDQMKELRQYRIRGTLMDAAFKLAVHSDDTKLNIMHQLIDHGFQFSCIDNLLSGGLCGGRHLLNRYMSALWTILSNYSPSRLFVPSTEMFDSKRFVVAVLDYIKYEYEVLHTNQLTKLQEHLSSANSNDRQPEDDLLILKYNEMKSTAPYTGSIVSNFILLLYQICVCFPFKRTVSYLSTSFFTEETNNFPLKTEHQLNELAAHLSNTPSLLTIVRTKLLASGLSLFEIRNMLNLDKDSRLGKMFSVQ
ncbi:hypothetical protein ACOME3_010478 [Neoechinorhynchus agilis]